MRILIIIFFNIPIYLFSQTNLDSLYSKYLDFQNKTDQNLPALFPSAHKCGFWIANQIKFNLSNFSLSQQNVLKKYTDRISSDTSVVSPSGFFRIHYNLISGIPSYNSSESIDKNIRFLGEILDSVFIFEVDILGYPPPPGDNIEGGDDKYDVYIKDYLGNVYAETFLESAVGHNIYTSYIIIDNDYSENGYASKGLNGLRVTLAHEFHHAIQIGNYGFRMQDRFFHEMTSTAMEEFMYDDINDYYNYNKLSYHDSYFRNPSRNFTKFEGYGLAIWNIFLKERYGYHIIKKQWEYFSNNNALTAINLSFEPYNTSFQRELNVFGIWAYLTSKNKMQNEIIDKTYNLGYFDEAENYPNMKMSFLTYTAEAFPITILSAPLSNFYIQILVNNSISLDTITAIITNNNIQGALDNSDDEEISYNLFMSYLEGVKPIANNYYYQLSSQNKTVFKEANFLNNRLVNGGTYLITESNYVYPNPFNYKRFEKLNFPVDYNQYGDAHLYIYSSSMDLVFDSSLKIVNSFDRFVVQWNGRDKNNNMLETGIYLYVCSSQDKMKKGKFIIYKY